MPYSELEVRFLINEENGEWDVIGADLLGGGVNKWDREACSEVEFTWARDVRIWEGEKGEKAGFKCWVDAVDILEGDGKGDGDGEEEESEDGGIAEAGKLEQEMTTGSCNVDSRIGRKSLHRQILAILLDHPRIQQFQRELAWMPMLRKK